MPWKLALSQHPMYFLIKEDALCAERTPPWGAPDIHAYLERLQANLAVLRRHPHVKMGFEWSGLEIEQLAQDAPDVLADMLALARRGQIAFYNGTYSQPHLQTLSAEANYRQFEFGARVYRELCGHPVLTYAHQETSFNEQTPQLLRAFGIRYAVLPHFIATLVIEGGEITYHAREGLMFVHGSEFAGWRGLDGTVIDTYLRQPRHGSLQDWLAYQEIKGLLHVPPVLVESPDLVAVDEDWLAERSQVEFVLLDEALPERLQTAPPRFQARLYANWSYIEGVRAEELSRANWLAERSALRAEALGALAFALTRRAPEATDDLWKTILTTQHHDVYCFCAPDLKRKSIGWLHAAENQAEQLTRSAAHALLQHIRPIRSATEQLVVFNTIPHPVISPVTIEVNRTNAALLDEDGHAVPCEALAVGPDRVQLRFIARGNALGYASYRLGEGALAAKEEALDTPLAFENEYYQAVLQPDGTLTALKTVPTGFDLLATSRVRGNQLAGRDSTGLGTVHAGIDDVSKPRVRWQPAARGPDLVWEPAATRLRRSPLGVTLTAAGRLGHRVQAKTVIGLYYQLPWIELTWEFDFDDASIGSFFDDETKLRVQWPLAYRGQIHHDIAFGHTRSLEERPFFPASWVDISDGQKGLAYCHQGTPKHWVKDGLLSNLFAWGEETDAIGNRLDMGRWPKTFDQRLRGHHTIRTAVYPHAGDWRAADVNGMARSFVYPPLAFLKDAGAGRLPAHLDVFALVGPNMAATAVKVEGDQVMCRCYSMGQPAEAGAYRFSGLRLTGLYALTGEVIEHLRPFQIGKLYLAPAPITADEEA